MRLVDEMNHVKLSCESSSAVICCLIVSWFEQFWSDPGERLIPPMVSSPDGQRMQPMCIQHLECVMILQRVECHCKVFVHTRACKIHEPKHYKQYMKNHISEEGELLLGGFISSFCISMNFKGHHAYNGMLQR